MGEKFHTWENQSPNVLLLLVMLLCKEKLHQRFVLYEYICLKKEHSMNVVKNIYIHFIVYIYAI
jgi:hypothetical protein